MKKLLAMSAVICMLLSGCTGNNAQNKKKDVQTVKWYNIGPTQSDEKAVIEKLNEKMAEKYGLELELELIDTGSYGDKMNMVISSGEEYDLCYTSNWLNVFSSVAAGGGFLELDDYLNGDFKNLYNTLPDFVWEGGKYNGRIMAVPNYQMLYRQSCVFIPERLTQKYNIDISKINSILSPEFEDMLAKVHEGEKDENLINIYDFEGYSILDDYLRLADVSFLAIDKDTYKVSSWFDTPQKDRELKLFREWYKKGYIRKDVISAQNSAGEDKYCVWAGATAPGTKESMKARKGEDIAIIPLTNPVITHGAGQATMTAVSVTSKNPSAALKAIEIMNTDKELYNMMIYGIEGVHYEQTSVDNVISLLDNEKPYCKEGYAFAYGNAFNAFYTDEKKVGINEEIDKINREAERSPLLGFSADLSAIKTEVAKINSVRTEYNYVNFGAEDPEPIMEEFRNKLDDAGMQTVINEIQKQIDEFIKNKK